MEDKKISIKFSTIITIIIFVLLVFIGLICYIVYNEGKKSVDQNTNYSYSYENSINNDDKNQQDYNTYNKDNTNIDTSSTDTSSIQAKESSKTNPLSIGEWGIASKHSSGNYVNVPTRVTNITRGSSAAKDVEAFCNSDSSIYKYEEPKEGMEWAIIEYDVDLTNFNSNTTISLDRKITGTGDNTSIKYNNTTYVVSTMNMTSNRTKSQIANAKFATQLPIGCSDYLIVLGSSSDTQAFIKGK